jgi:hypothetical protein
LFVEFELTESDTHQRRLYHPHLTIGTRNDRIFLESGGRFEEVAGCGWNGEEKRGGKRGGKAGETAGEIAG